MRANCSRFSRVVTLSISGKHGQLSDLSTASFAPGTLPYDVYDHRQLGTFSFSESERPITFCARKPEAISRRSIESVDHET